MGAAPAIGLVAANGAETLVAGGADSAGSVFTGACGGVPNCGLSGDDKESLSLTGI